MTKSPAADKILAARTALLWDQPFFGTLAVQLEVVDATDDPRIDTMATDGRRLYYHGPFVEKLSKKELIFVVAHEILHNAFEHTIRRQHRDPRLFNVACDFAINLDLVDSKIGEMPKVGLIDERFRGMGSEEIYRILHDEIQKSGGGGGGGEGGSQFDPGGCGQVLDACPQHDEAAISQRRLEIQTQVRQAAAVARAANAGSLPAGIQRIVDQLLAPKVDWRAVLRRFIDGQATRDFAWTKPNRRLIPHGIHTPSMISDSISHLVVAIDTSGSIDHEILRDFASELNGIFGDGLVDRVSVLYADASVAHIDEFERGDELVINAAGGGGTAFSDTFRVISERYNDAVCAIYFSDMFVHDFGQEPEMPVLWAVHGRTKDFDTIKPPFGETINISAGA